MKRLGLTTIALREQRRCVRSGRWGWRVDLVPHNTLAGGAVRKHITRKSINFNKFSIFVGSHPSLVVVCWCFDILSWDKTQGKGGDKNEWGSERNHASAKCQQVLVCDWGSEGYARL